MRRPFAQVDVFSSTPYGGNPVAVVLDASGLDTAQMERVARWTNLSETTFVLEPGVPEADYRVRIFTPAAELPFAGHPTLGTCHAWLAHGSAPRPAAGEVVQECAAGLIRVRETESGLAFAAPPLVRSGPVDERLVKRLAALLGIEREEIVDSQWVDNGPGWVAVLLDSAEAVLALRPGAVDLCLGVVGPCAAGAREDFEVRAFFPKDGASVEDPVTGSLNASLAEWLLRTGRARAPYVVRQGTLLARDGRVHMTQQPDGTIWVGGATTTLVAGEVEVVIALVAGGGRDPAPSVEYAPVSWRSAVLRTMDRTCAARSHSSCWHSCSRAPRPPARPRRRSAARCSRSATAVTRCEWSSAPRSGPSTRAARSGARRGPGRVRFMASGGRASVPRVAGRPATLRFHGRVKRVAGAVVTLRLADGRPLRARDSAGIALRSGMTVLVRARIGHAGGMRAEVVAASAATGAGARPAAALSAATAGAGCDSAGGGGDRVASATRDRVASANADRVTGANGDRVTRANGDDPDEQDDPGEGGDDPGGCQAADPPDPGEAGDPDDPGDGGGDPGDAGDPSDPDDS